MMANNQIDIEIKIEEDYKIPKVVIYTNQVSDEITRLINKLKVADDEKIIGFKDDEAYIIDFAKIELIYTENKKIFARADGVAYQIKKRIFELEESLEDLNFVRISNSEIVNFKMVSSIDFKLTGTMMLKLRSGKNTFVSRRYVKKVKEYLGL